METARAGRPQIPRAAPWRFDDDLGARGKLELEDPPFAQLEVRIYAAVLEGAARCAQGLRGQGVEPVSSMG